MATRIAGPGPGHTAAGGPANRGAAGAADRTHLRPPAHACLRPGERGRHPARLRGAVTSAGASPGQPALLAVDAGGTRLRIAVFDRDRTVLHRSDAQTPHDDAGAAVAAMREALDASDVPVRSAVVGVPGLVDYSAGEVLSLPNLPAWEGRISARRLAGALDLPVLLANDADLAALGEHRYGVGRGTSDMVYVTVSTRRGRRGDHRRPAPSRPMVAGGGGAHDHRPCEWRDRGGAGLRYGAGASGRRRRRRGGGACGRRRRASERTAASGGGRGGGRRGESGLLLHAGTRRHRRRPGPRRRRPARPCSRAPQLPRAEALPCSPRTSCWRAAATTPGCSAPLRSGATFSAAAWDTPPPALLRPPADAPA